jgi:hypothetical protein
MPDDDPYARTRLRAAKQADEDLRRDEPWLWLFAHVVTRMIHLWVALRLWWLNREGYWTSTRQNLPRIPS